MEIEQISHNIAHDNTPYDNVRLWLFTDSTVVYDETVVGVNVEMYSRIILNFKDKMSAIKFIDSINVNNMSETKIRNIAKLRFYKGNKLQFEETIRIKEN